MAVCEKMFKVVGKSRVNSYNIRSFCSWITIVEVQSELTDKVRIS